MPIYDYHSIPESKLAFFRSHPELDWLIGGGFVKSALSLWGGEAGIGKTRILTGLCKYISSKGMTDNEGIWHPLTALYHQNEMSLSQFKNQYLSSGDIHFKISDSNNLNIMFEEWRSVMPDLVVIDSINKLEEFSNSQSALNKIERQIRKMASITGCHVALITHLNQAGGIKGGTLLPHMVDTVIHIEGPEAWGYKVDDGSIFVSIPDKNRFGKTGEFIVMSHMKNGVGFYGVQRRFGKPNGTIGQ